MHYNIININTEKITNYILCRRWRLYDERCQQRKFSEIFVHVNLSSVPAAGVQSADAHGVLCSFRCVGLPGRRD